MVVLYTIKDPACCRGSNKAPRLIGAHYSSNMSNGTVKFFNTEKGFGFITPTDGGRDIFVHKTAIAHPIQEGDMVTFEVEQGPKGPNALNVNRA